MIKLLFLYNCYQQYLVAPFPTKCAADIVVCIFVLTFPFPASSYLWIPIVLYFCIFICFQFFSSCVLFVCLPSESWGRDKMRSLWKNDGAEIFTHHQTDPDTSMGLPGLFIFIACSTFLPSFNYKERRRKVYSEWDTMYFKKCIWYSTWISDTFLNQGVLSEPIYTLFSSTKLYYTQVNWSPPVNWSSLIN